MSKKYVRLRSVQRNHSKKAGLAGIGNLSGSAKRKALQKANSEKQARMRSLHEFARMNKTNKVSKAAFSREPEVREEVEAGPGVPSFGK